MTPTSAPSTEGWAFPQSPADTSLLRPRAWRHLPAGLRASPVPGTPQQPWQQAGHCPGPLANLCCSSSIARLPLLALGSSEGCRGSGLLPTVPSADASEQHGSCEASQARGAKSGLSFMFFSHPLAFLNVQVSSHVCHRSCPRPHNRAERWQTLQPPALQLAEI